MTTLDKIRQQQASLHQMERTAVEKPAAPAPARSKTQQKKLDKAARAAEKPKQADKVPAVQEPQWRLPHGSRHEMTFDAQAVLWRGSLTVPGGNGDVVFQGQASGISRLVGDLGRMYRETLTASPAEEDTTR